MVEFTHDRGTVAAGRWMLFTSAIILVAFFVAGVFGQLPGQSKYVPKIMRMRNLDEKGKLPRLILEVPMRPYHFGGKVPADFRLDAAVNDEQITKNWTISEAHAYIIDPMKNEQELDSEFESAGKNRCTVSVMGAFDPKADYFVDIYLAPAGDKKSDYSKLSADEKAKSHQQYVDDFIKLRDDARAAAINGVTVKLD